MKNLGITLLIVGLIMTVFTGFNLVTQKKVLDLGTVEVTRKETTPIYWSPVTGGILAVAGLAILLIYKKKT
jgi:hypothetical protein